ncbi:MAG TPA: GspH/FimT family pseudopilin [Trinickia sp.]
MHDSWVSGRRASRGYRHGRGFSLVEMLVVTALVACSAMAAAPVLSAWHARDRVDAAARALLAGLTLARGEAIARGVRVVVCPALDGTRCLRKGRACAAGAFDWSCGWAVVPATRLPGQALRTYRRNAGISIVATPAHVEFTPPAGQIIGGFRNFEVVAAGAMLRGGSDALRRCIRVAAGGRARLDRGRCDAAGNA